MLWWRLPLDRVWLLLAMSAEWAQAGVGVTFHGCFVQGVSFGIGSMSIPINQCMHTWLPSLAAAPNAIDACLVIHEIHCANEVSQSARRLPERREVDRSKVNLDSILLQSKKTAISMLQFAPSALYVAPDGKMIPASTLLHLGHESPKSFAIPCFLWRKDTCLLPNEERSE